MTANGWLQIVFFCARACSPSRSRSACYLVRVYDGPGRGCGRSSARSTGWRRRPGRGPALDPVRRGDAALQRRVDAAHVRRVAPAARAAAQPAGTRRRCRTDRRSRPRRRSRRTRTGSRTSGESTMSYFSQMTQLAFHNFVSAAVGHGASRSRSCAASRGASSAGRLGNFWVDLVRGTLYVLLPLSLLVALILVQQGVIQNFRPYLEVTTLEGAKQTIAMGPVASQEAIKQLGTNGGGFFNANAAHPFENPTPWTNFWSMFTIFMIPSALTYLLGRMVANQRHGWAVWAAMFVLFFAGVDHRLLGRGARQSDSRGTRRRSSRRPPTNPGGNMEGKEVRFGIANSALYATVTTDASCGAVNCDARLVHAARRAGAAGQHAARRGDLRRRRRRTLRHARDGRAHGVHRRAHGRPDAGVPRQEDPGARGPDGDALRARLSRGRS